MRKKITTLLGLGLLSMPLSQAYATGLAHADKLHRQARIEQLKSTLQIRLDQEAAWKSYLGAVKKMQQAANTLQSPIKPLSENYHTEKAIKLTETLERLKTLQTTTSHLYYQLNTEQQAKFHQLLQKWEKSQNNSSKRDLV